MVTLRPYGASAVLIEGDSFDPARLASRLLTAALPGVVDVVAGARTVLVDADTPASIVDVTHLVERWLDAGVADATDDRRPVALRVRLDGPDLIEVTTRCGLGADELAERLAATPLRVAFCGFAPGFAYLDGLDPVLHLPRRDTPRTRVPAGSFAVAAGYAAVYPGPSPGGWHLLGSSETVVWDVDRDPPALLTPGTEVRIEVVDR